MMLVRPCATMNDPTVNDAGLAHCVTMIGPSVSDAGEALCNDERPDR